MFLPYTRHQLKQEIRPQSINSTQPDSECWGLVAQSAVVDVPEGKPCGEMLPSSLLSVPVLAASLMEDLGM